MNLILGDCAQKLTEFEPDFFDLCVTSPPYDKLRTYNGHSEWDFEAVAKELYRVIKPGGVVCWNIGDSVVDGSETLTSCKQKIFFRESCGFRIHDTMIYERLNFSAPESVRYHQAFEYLFILSRGAPKCFNAIKDRKNIYAGKTAFGKNTKRQADGSFNPIAKKVYAEFGMRTNIWRGKTRGQEEPCKKLSHPAMMPKWLARDLILTFSNELDTVLDPFAGSCTVGIQADALFRESWMIEKNPEFVSQVKL